jgi:hypothetical protein
MFEFLKILYQLGKISKEKLYTLVGKKITQQEYDSIVRKEE